jgi:hypothetical protein
METGGHAVTDWDEDDVEEMIEACRTAADDDPKRFTAWEIRFLEELEDRNVDHHLTESQVDKLRQIYEERCGG